MVAAVVAVLVVDAAVVSAAEATPVVVSAGAAVFAAHFAVTGFGDAFPLFPVHYLASVVTVVAVVGVSVVVAAAVGAVVVVACPVAPVARAQCGDGDDDDGVCVDVSSSSWPNFAALGSC